MSEGRSPPRPIRRAVRYSLLAYAVSWTLWGVWALLPGSSVVLFVLGTFGPFVAGAVLTRADGRGVVVWLRAIFDYRLPVRYYLLAVAVPVVVLLVAAATHRLVFDGAVVAGTSPPVVEYPIYLGFVLLFGGGLEEPGWRGYLLPTLQRRVSALTAAVAVGVVWAGWHAPLFLVPNTIQSGLSPSLYVVQIVALSVVLTAVTNAADGRVLPAMVLHAGGNAVVSFYPIGGAAGATTRPGFGLLVGVLAVVALGVVGRYGPERLAPAG